ncbi:MAG: 2-isopropylmalate synthase [Clostridia bacterium]|nr:2-isopropylmalate synthase [Clostridia bacterium]
MPKLIRILDTTLRDGEQSPGCSMNQKEKLEIARQLEKLNVDVIEAGFAITSSGDFESVRAIAETAQQATVASLARLVQKDIDAAADAVRPAKHPRVHVFLATSPLHMRYKLQMTENQALDHVRTLVRYAKSLVEDIEFSAEDATRSDWDFLTAILTEATKAGATTLNVADTVGYTTPAEMIALMRHLIQTVPGTDKTVFSAHCHNDLGLATANSLAAIQGGATQVECTLCGIGERAGNASLEEIVMALHTRGDQFDAKTTIDTRRIYRASSVLSRIIGQRIPPNKAIIGSNAFAHESGIHQHGVLQHPSTYEIISPESIGLPENQIVLGKHSGRHAFIDRLQALGIQLSPEALDDAFNRFKSLADRKKTVSDRDVEALTTGGRVAFDEQYTLENFVVNSGSSIDATATIALRTGDEIKKISMIGTGQIEAAFSAINALIGVYPTLADYSLHSVSEGEDAQGDVTVRLTLHDTNVTGRGLSVDIVEASIRAYLNGMNKLLV